VSFKAVEWNGGAYGSRLLLFPIYIGRVCEISEPDFKNPIVTRRKDDVLKACVLGDSEVRDIWEGRWDKFKSIHSTRRFLCKL
jgi:hypothetical protein